MLGSTIKEVFAANRSVVIDQCCQVYSGNLLCWLMGGLGVRGSLVSRIYGEVHSYFREFKYAG